MNIEQKAPDARRIWLFKKGEVMKGWFYQTFICGHWFSGQIKVKKKRFSKRHYRECQKCGKKVWVD
jgi:hypothetical protein